MTKRQEQAVRWLESVGKTTPRSLRRAGFAQRTFDALADAGHIERHYVTRSPFANFPVYRPLKGKES